MAAVVPPGVPSEYVRIYDLPPASTLPAELQKTILYKRVKFVHGKTSSVEATVTGAGTGNAAGEAKGKSSAKQAKSTGFNYSKALKAALDGAGSSVNSRGDGKFDDGKDFKVSDAPGGRAKLVHLTPEALSGANAERTLQELDKLQQQARPIPSTSRPPAAAANTFAPSRPPQPSSRSGQSQHAAMLAAAAKTLYDISDEYDSTGGGSSISVTTTTTTRPPATAAVAGAAVEPSGGLRVPEHTVREVPTDNGPAGQHQGVLEVAVLLPEVESPTEVDVWLGGGGTLQVAVPGRYQLKLDLPYPVLDDTSRAKWSKAKRRLTLTLTRR